MENSIWWTKDEIGCLLEMEKHRKVTREELASKLPNRSLESIRAKKKCLKLKLRIIANHIRNQWTPEEDQIIKEYYFSDGCKDKILSLMPNRKWHNINRRATALGMMKKIWWSEEEENLLRKIYYNSTDEKLKLSFPTRSMESIDLHANIIDLKKGYKNARKSDLSILLSETPETYYWIGFLLADGHIDCKIWRLNFTLALKDAESVIQFAKFIKCNNIQIYKNVHISVSPQDKEILPKLCEKFKIVSRKTYSPPSLDFIANDNLLLSLIIGYIDGDGCVKNLQNRKDFCISMQCHSSWKDIYSLFENKIYNIFNISKRKNVSLTKINKSGYASLNFGDSRVCKKLKEKALEMNLPIMKRKWNRIDLCFISRQEQADKRKEMVVKLHRENKSINEIADIMKCKYTCIYQILRKIEPLQ